MDRTRFSTGRENPPADYVFEVTCEDDAEIAIKSQIVSAVTRPGFQLKSLRSSDTSTPNEVQVRAELSANTRDDTLLENAVSLFSAEPKVRSVRWALQNDRAPDWTGSGSG
jgi:putative Mg2+ transporter-C (MgtC) family protein